MIPWSYDRSIKKVLDNQSSCATCFSFKLLLLLNCFCTFDCWLLHISQLRCCLSWVNDAGVSEDVPFGEHNSSVLTYLSQEPRLEKETRAREVKSHVGQMQKEDCPSACWSLVPAHAGHFASPLVERLLKSKHQSIFSGSLSPLLFLPLLPLQTDPVTWVVEKALHLSSASFSLVHCNPDTETAPRRTSVSLRIERAVSSPLFPLWLAC